MAPVGDLDSSMLSVVADTLQEVTHKQKAPILDSRSVDPHEALPDTPDDNLGSHDFTQVVSCEQILEHIKLTDNQRLQEIAKYPLGKKCGGTEYFDLYPYLYPDQCAGTCLEADLALPNISAPHESLDSPIILVTQERPSLLLEGCRLFEDGAGPCFTPISRSDVFSAP